MAPTLIFTPTASAKPAIVKTQDFVVEKDGVVVVDGSVLQSREEVVCEVLRKLLVGENASKLLSTHADKPFLLVDVGRAGELMAEWRQALPRVRPFYAVKCNTNPLFLRTLAALGAGFDCASKEEIHKVLGLDISPNNDVVFANACKLESDIACAAGAGVHLTTFDSEAELQKIKSLDMSCKAKLLLRIATDDEGATIRLSSKYGARMEEVEVLLQSAANEGLAVVGVAFHIGSGASNPHSFSDAIANARHIFDLSKKMFGRASQMHILDIGGGFCSSGPELEEGSTGGGITVQDAAPLINQALHTYFPSHYNDDNSSYCMPLQIIAEPGRYFACSPFTLVTRIFGKRMRGNIREYWINDGAHGSFTMILLPHNTHVPSPIPFACVSSPHNLSCNSLPLFASNVFGPTCSALDAVLKDHPLPELQIGDLLAFPFMGAYTLSLATRFNGFSVTDLLFFGFMDKAKV